MRFWVLPLSSLYIGNNYGDQHQPMSFAIHVWAYVLSASECKNLDGECRNKRWCEMDQVNFPGFRSTHQWVEITKYDDNNQVYFDNQISGNRVNDSLTALTDREHSDITSVPQAVQTAKTSQRSQYEHEQ